MVTASIYQLTGRSISTNAIIMSYFDFIGRTCTKWYGNRSHYHYSHYHQGHDHQEHVHKGLNNWRKLILTLHKNLNKLILILVFKWRFDIFYSRKFLYISMLGCDVYLRINAPSNVLCACEQGFKLGVRCRLILVAVTLSGILKAKRCWTVLAGLDAAATS